MRTLNTRPANYYKTPPIKKNVEPIDEPPQVQETLFNPGKLADETQLGSITSLINFSSQLSNSNIIKTPCTTVTDKETDKHEDDTKVSPEEFIKNSQLSPPVSFISLSMPPKPFKKRMLQQNKDNKHVVRSIFSSNGDESDIYSNLQYSDPAEDYNNSSITRMNDEENETEAMQDDDFLTHSYVNLNNNTNSNVTNQDLIDKVVDHMCSSINGNERDPSECITCSTRQRSSKEQRTSVRSCKGLRYAKFMAEGKLLVNKRSKKNDSPLSFFRNSVMNHSDENIQVPRHEPIELNETIKKLAERTAKNINIQNEYDGNTDEHYFMKNLNDASEDHYKKVFRAADFNLDAKIEALPSLSLEKFLQKKKDSKKKKFFRNSKTILHSELKKEQKIGSKAENNNTITGSRKRKPRKQSITRLDPQNDKFNVVPQPEADLFGLATLAEVAAKKPKIDQQ